MEPIESLSDAELCSTGHIARTGTTALGSYRVLATSSHYDWAMKRIRHTSERVA